MKHILYDLPSAFGSNEIKECVKDFSKLIGVSVQNVIDNYIPYLVVTKYKIKNNEYYKNSFLLFLPKSIIYFDPYMYAYYINMVIKDLQNQVSKTIYSIHTIKPNPNLYHYTRYTPNNESIFKMFHNNIFYLKTYDKRYPNIRSYI